MVKKRYVFLALLLAVSCSQQPMPEEFGDVEMSIRSSVQDGTRTVLDESMSMAKWESGALISVAAKRDGDFISSKLATFKGQNTSLAASAVFAGLLPKSEAGTYEFFGMYPKAVSPFHDLSFYLKSYQLPAADSFDGSCDLMLARTEGQTIDGIEKADIRMEFKHMFGWLKMDMSAFAAGAHAGETVQHVTLTADKPICGTVKVDIADASITPPDKGYKTITLDYRGKDISLQNLKAYFTLFPGNYSSVEVKVYTESHTLSFNRSGMQIYAGKISDVSMSSKAEDIVSEQVGLPELPPAPGPGEVLHVLLFGHSFGYNSTEYIPQLIKYAGIDNVYLGRFYYSGSSIPQHLEKLVYDIPYDYHHATCGSGKWEKFTKTSREVLKSVPWDIIIYQDGLKQEGDFSVVEKPLNEFMDSVSVIMSKYHPETEIVHGWNLFFPRWTNYYYGSTKADFEKYCQCAKDVLANTRVRFVVSAGAALQNLRATSLCTDETRGFTRDGEDPPYHSSNGAGQYVCSCAWFDTLFKPLFDKTSLGSGVRIPLNTSTVSGRVKSTWDVVDDTNAELIQKCGVAAAKDKYSVTIVE